MLVHFMAELSTFIIVGETGYPLHYYKTEPSTVGELGALIQKRIQVLKQNTFYLDTNGIFLDENCQRSALPSGKMIVFNERSSVPQPPSIDLRSPTSNDIEEYTALYKDYEKFLSGSQNNLVYLIISYKAAVTWYNTSRKNDRISSFAKEISEFYNKQAEYLQSFEADIEQLNNISLDPALQNISWKTLHDVVSPESLREYKEEFEEDLSGLLNIVNSLGSNQSNVEIDRLEDFNSSLNASKSESQKLEKFRNMLLQRVQSGSHEEQYSYMQLRENYNTQAIKMQQLLGEALQFVHENLKKIFQFRVVVRKVQQHQKLYDSLKNRFSHLQYPKQAPQAYKAGLQEIARRNQFKQWFDQQLCQVNDWIREVFQQEERARTDFITSYGRYFPIKLAPDLRNEPPDWSVHFPDPDNIPQINTPVDVPPVSYRPLLSPSETLEREATIRNLEQALADAERCKNDLQRQNEESTTTTVELRSQNEKLQETLRGQEEAIRTLQTSAKERDLLQEELTDKIHEIQTLQERIEALRVSESSLEESTTKLLTTEEQLEQEKHKNATLEDKIIVLMKKNQDFHTTSLSTAKQLADLQEKYSQVLGEKDNDQAALSVAAKQAEELKEALYLERENVLQLEQDKAAISLQVEELQAEKSTLLQEQQQTENRLQETLLEMNKLQNSLSKLQGEVERANAKLSESSCNESTNAALQQDIRELRRQIEVMEEEKRNVVRAMAEVESMKTVYQVQVTDLSAAYEETKGICQQTGRQLVDTQNALEQMKKQNAHLYQQLTEAQQALQVEKQRGNNASTAEVLRLQHLNEGLKENLRANTERLNSLEDDYERAKRRILELTNAQSSESIKPLLRHIFSTLPTRLLSGENIICYPRKNAYIALCNNSEITYCISPDCLQHIPRSGSLFVGNVIGTNEQAHLATATDNPYQLPIGTKFIEVYVSMVNLPF